MPKISHDPRFKLDAKAIGRTELDLQRALNEIYIRLKAGHKSGAQSTDDFAYTFTVGEDAT